MVCIYITGLYQTDESWNLMTYIFIQSKIPISFYNNMMCGLKFQSKIRTSSLLQRNRYR